MNLTTSALEYLGFIRFGKSEEMSAIEIRQHRMMFNQASGGGNLEDGREYFLDYTAVIDDTGSLWALRNGTVAWTVPELCVELKVYGFKEEPMFFFPTKEMIERLATFR